MLGKHEHIDNAGLGNELVSDTTLKMEYAGLCMAGQARAGQVRVDTVAILAVGKGLGSKAA